MRSRHCARLILLSLVLAVGTGARAAVDRPNVVLIIGDDISPDFSCYQGPVHTPNIDGIASSGVRFDNAYVTASSCSPSRCSIITGRYPHNTGAPELHMGLPPGQFLFPQALRQAGYYSAQYGKFHMGDNAKPAFDVVHDIPYPEDPTGAAGWVECLRARPQDKPFFMWFAAYDAHRPWEADPAAPPHDLRAVVVPAGVPDTPLARQDLASYYDEVRRFDRNVGKVIDELKAEGVYENTIIIVVGDNGRPFPRNKTYLYDNGMKVPLIVRWPAGGFGVGQVSTSLVSSIDLAPLLLEVTGLPVPDSVQGISMLPVCRDPSRPTRPVLFGEQNWHVQRECGRMVRRGDYVYLRDFTPHLYLFQMVDHATGAYAELLRLRELHRLTPEQEESFSENRPAEALFDVRADPDQLRDLATDPRYQTVRAELRRLLDVWQDRTGDSIPAVQDMTPDRFDRRTFKPLYTGARPPTGEYSGQRAVAVSIVAPDSMEPLPKISSALSN